jgi:hypothetical protein
MVNSDYFPNDNGIELTYEFAKELKERHENGLIIADSKAIALINKVVGMGETK